MFNKKKKPAIQSVRSRQAKPTLTESFRRNTVVMSRGQRELAARQQSVTQRQIDLKRSLTKKRRRNQLIIAVVLVATIAFLYRMQVQDVTVTSNASTKLQGTQQRQYAAEIMTAYSTATIFGQSWLLDSDALTKKILTDHPEIERVTLTTSTPLNTTLQADLRFRKPVFTWRDASQATQFVDGNGVLFEKNLDPTVDTAKLIQIEDQSGVVLDTGTSVLTANIITFIGQLHGKIVELYGSDASVEKVIIPRSTREVQIKMKNTPYIIKFNANRTIGEQIGELSVLLKHLNATGDTPVEYIDVRTPHKAFYR